MDDHMKRAKRAVRGIEKRAAKQGYTVYLDVGEVATAMAASDDCHICGRTPAEYERKSAATFKRPINPRPRRHAVDHNPKTGLFRGLLCSYCNAGMGVVDAQPDALFNYIAPVLDQAGWERKDR